ncbi:MAG: FhaA domain-containing protein [Schwartzia sp. (in: firmicutes)]
MGLIGWEGFFEKNIAGMLQRRFARVLAPAAVEQAIEQELIERRKKSRRGDFVPNAFTLRLHPEDYRRLASRRFLEDLHVYVEKLLILADVYMDERLHLRLAEDEALGVGQCEITSCFEVGSVLPAKTNAEDGTLVLVRTPFAMPLNLPPKRELASLTAVEGADKEASISFGEHTIYIGRREKNELILTDRSVSRLHACITYRRHRHVLCDAGSLNGTLVNGVPVRELVLQDGDEVQMGNTLLRYEVL